MAPPPKTKPSTPPAPTSNPAADPRSSWQLATDNWQLRIRLEQRYERRTRPTEPERPQARRLRQRPGNPLVPGLRGLLDPDADEEDPRQARRGPLEDRLHLRHRLLQPLPLLHEHLRLPLDPRPRADFRDRVEARPPRPR